MTHFAARLLRRPSHRSHRQGLHGSSLHDDQSGIGTLLFAVGFLPFMLLFGALVVEFSTDPFADAGQLDTLTYNLSTVPEEALEMGGVILLIRALIAHLGDGRPLSVAIGPQARASQGRPSRPGDAA